MEGVLAGGRLVWGRRKEDNWNGRKMNQALDYGVRSIAWDIIDLVFGF